MRRNCAILLVALPLALCAQTTLPNAFSNGNSSLTCEDVHKVSKAAQCQFVRQNCDTEDHHIGIFNYLEMYYCTEAKLFSVTASVASLIFSFISLGLTASDYLCPNLYSISKALDLSDNLAGLTLLAVGNGSPDVLGTFKALSIGSAGLAVSELVGAALFILTVVVGSISIVSPFKVPKYHFLRDVVFYTSVCVILWVSLVVGQFNYVNSSVLVSLYVVYVVVAVYSHSWLRQNTKKHIATTRMLSRFDDDAHVALSDNMDQSYFDQLSAFPSIDALSTSSDEPDAAHEFGKYLQTHPHEERVPVETGSYGLHVLLRELSKHSIHVQSVPLLARARPILHARPFTAPATTLVSTEVAGALAPGNVLNYEETVSLYRDDEETPEEDEDDGFSRNPNMTLWKRVGQRLSPEFCADQSWFDRLTIAVCAPANVLFKLTTPNREQATRYGEHLVSASNAFTFGLAGQAEEDDEFADFDFEADTQLYRVQVVFGTVFLVFNVFGLTLTGLLVAIVSAAVAGLASLLLPTKAPKFEKHLLRYRAWNYFGSLLGFIMSLCWVSIFAAEIVAVIKALAVILQLSDDILGSTVFALGNSVGDLVSNITIASMGMPVMAFSACFGGPLLALCSLGFSSILVMSEQDKTAIFVKFSPTLKLNLLALLLSQIFIVTFVPRNGWKFDRRVGTILISIWFFSVLSSILLEVAR